MRERFSCLATVGLLVLLLVSAPTYSGTSQAEQPGSKSGTVRVEVRLIGEAPDLPVIVTHKNRDFCGEELRDPVLLGSEGGVANAVVSLGASDQDFGFEAEPAQGLSVRSVNCLLEPRIQVGRSGTLLTLQSGDRITHNPHGWFGERTVFNVTLAKPELAFRRSLRLPGVYRVDCDTHSWMKAYILLFDHPLFALTDDDGIGTITQAPAGKHEVLVWHEILGVERAEAMVEPGRTVEIKVVYPLIDKRPQELRPTTVKPWP